MAEIKYNLVITSTCSEGQDTTTILFSTLEDAVAYMKEHFVEDKKEFKQTDKLIAELTDMGYEIYYDGRYIEDNITANIIKMVEKELMRFDVFDISWDEADDSTPIDITTDILVDVEDADERGIIEDRLSDKISNEYGFCHFGFNYQEIWRKTIFVEA